MAIIGDAAIEVGADTTKFSKDVEGQVTNVAKKAATAFGAAFGAKQVFDFAKDSIGAASDLNETISKTQVVFGGAAQSVLKFGDTSSTSIGASRNEALSAAGTFGNLLRSVGLTENQAAKFSVSMVQLAGDLASFNNVPVGEALEAIRSGLVGETEPLKRFGVNLNEATLKQQAMNMGLSDGKGVLDANAKAQAAYALIMQQTTLAQGDFARTSDGLANQQRSLAAEFENVKASIGQSLLPFAKELVAQIRESLPEFQDLAENALPALANGFRAGVPVGMSFLRVLVALSPLLETAADLIEAIPAPLLTMATGMGLLGSGMGPLPNLFSQFTKGMQSVPWNTTSGFLTSLTAGFGALNPLVVAGAIAIPILANHMQHAAEREREWAQAIDAANAALMDRTQGVREDIANTLKQRIEGKELQGELADLGMTYDQLAKSLAGGQLGMNRILSGIMSNKDASKDLTNVINDVYREYYGQAEAAINAAVASGELTKAQVKEAAASHSLLALRDGEKVTLTDWLAVYQELIPVTKEETTATQKATSALAANAKQLKDTTDALDDFLGKQIEAVGGTIAYEGALDDLTEGIKENGRTLDLNTEKGRDNMQNLLSVRESIIKVTEQRYRETQSADQAAYAAQGMIDRLKDELRQRGLSEQAINDYVAALKLTPSEVKTQLVVNAAQAKGELMGFATLVEAIGKEAADKFVQGVVGGFRDNEGRIRTSADALAHNIESAVNRRLGIQSPSKVGEQVGAYFVEGITKGIDGGSKDAQDAIARVGAYMEESIYRAAAVTREEERAILQAHQAIVDSQERLNEVRKDAKHTAQQLRAAELDVALAQEAYNRVVAESTDTTAAMAEAQQHLADVAAHVRDQVSSVFGAFSAGFGATDARQGLTRATEEVRKLQQEQAGLPKALAEAQQRLMDAQKEAAKTTPEEALAIARAQQRVVDATDKLAEVQGDATSTALDLKIAQLELKVAERDLKETRDDAEAATREVSDAEKALTELRQDASTITQRLQEATQAEAEAKLRVVEANQRLRDAQAELIAQGPDALGTFRDMATAAGLSRREVDDLVASLQHLGEVTNPRSTGGGTKPNTKPIPGSKQPSRDVQTELQRLANENPNNVIWGANGRVQPTVVFGKDSVKVGVMDTSLVMAKLNVQSAIGTAVSKASRLRPA